MVTRSVACRRRVVLAALLVSSWAGGAGAAVTLGRERPEAGSGVVTPHPEAARQYKYIPLGYRERDYIEEETAPPEPEPPRPKLAPSELILTVMRTALDVVRRVNSNRAAAAAAASRGKLPPPPPPPPPPPANTTELQERGRGHGDMDDYYDDHHDTTTTAKPAKPRYTDPWAGYYDFIINEGSFKFWSVFQLFTAALLLYACLSAIYYAKFNPIIPDYDREYDDYFLERSAGRAARSLHPAHLPSGISWMAPSTFQFIMDALATNYKQ